MLARPVPIRVPILSIVSLGTNRRNRLGRSASNLAQKAPPFGPYPPKPIWFHGDGNLDPTCIYADCHAAGLTMLEAKAQADISLMVKSFRYVPIAVC